MNGKYRVLGRAPEDARLRIDRHTDKFFDITNFDSLEEVEKRKEELKFNLRMAAGLYPWPDKTPLNIETETVGEFDGYTVKKISFESYPGFRSTGNLYLPSPNNKSSYRKRFRKYLTLPAPCTKSGSNLFKHHT